MNKKNLFLLLISFTTISKKVLSAAQFTYPEETKYNREYRAYLDEMLPKVRIIKAGNSPFKEGEIVDHARFKQVVDEINAHNIKAYTHNKEMAKAPLDKSIRSYLCFHGHEAMTVKDLPVGEPIEEKRHPLKALLLEKIDSILQQLLSMAELKEGYEKYEICRLLNKERFNLKTKLDIAEQSKSKSDEEIYALRTQLTQISKRADEAEQLCIRRLNWFINSTVDAMLSLRKGINERCTIQGRTKSTIYIDDFYIRHLISELLPKLSLLNGNAKDFANTMSPDDQRIISQLIKDSRTRGLISEFIPFLQETLAL